MQVEAGVRSEGMKLSKALEFLIEQQTTHKPDRKPLEEPAPVKDRSSDDTAWWRESSGCPPSTHSKGG